MALGIGGNNIRAGSLRRQGAIQSEGIQAEGAARAAGQAALGQAAAQAVGAIPAAMQGLRRAEFQQQIREGQESIRAQHLQQVADRVKKDVIPGVAQEIDQILASTGAPLQTKLDNINKLIPNKINRDQVYKISTGELQGIIGEAAAETGVDSEFANQLLMQKAQVEAQILQNQTAQLASTGKALGPIIRKTRDNSIATEFVLQSTSMDPELKRSIMAAAESMDSASFADFLEGKQKTSTADPSTVRIRERNLAKMQANDSGEAVTYTDSITGESVTVNPDTEQIRREEEVKSEAALTEEGFQPATEGQKNNPLLRNEPEVFRNVAGGMVKLRTLPDKDRDTLIETNILREEMSNLGDDLKRLGIELDPVTNRIPLAGPALVAFTKSPEYQAFNAKAMQAFNRYRKRITGAQASFQEIQFLLQSMPTAQDRDPETFMAKMNAVLEATDAAYETRLQNLENNAFNVTAFREGVPAAARPRAARQEARPQAPSRAPQAQGILDSDLDKKLSNYGF